LKAFAVLIALYCERIFQKPDVQPSNSQNGPLLYNMLHPLVVESHQRFTFRLSGANLPETLPKFIPDSVRESGNPFCLSHRNAPPSKPAK